MTVIVSENETMTVKLPIKPFYTYFSIIPV